MISSIEPEEICTKMLRNWREKLRIIYLDEKKRQQKEKNGSEKNNTKTEKPKGVGPFLVQKQNFDFFVHMYLSKIILKSDVKAVTLQMPFCVDWSYSDGFGSCPGLKGPQCPKNSFC